MTNVVGWEMRAVGQPLQQTTRDLTELAADQVRVRVVGCGVCHTDLGFLYDGVRTRQPLPLILGHEISGIVEAAGADFAQLVGKAVVVPAVLPCGQCADCTEGYPHICSSQVMPGNDCDGGFASHTVLPGRWLCELPLAVTDPDAQLGAVEGLNLRHLAVIADAVSTPYSAVVRAGLQAGDVAVVIGLGGVGGYAAQIAADAGATVVGVDVDPLKLAGAEALGCALAVDPRDSSTRDLRKRIKTLAKERGARGRRWKIFECSGTAPGQQTAFGLLVHGATLMVVGYTMAKIELRLSNLMAFDARAMGNWGCDPALYPAILELVLAGRVQVAPHCDVQPLSRINHVFEQVHAGNVAKRIVLAPDLT